MIDEDKVIEDMQDSINKMVSDCFACGVDGHRLNLALGHGIAKTIALHFESKERARDYMKELLMIMARDAYAMLDDRKNLAEIVAQNKNETAVSNDFFLKHMFNPEKPNA